MPGTAGGGGGGGGLRGRAEMVYIPRHNSPSGAPPPPLAVTAPSAIQPRRRALPGKSCGRGMGSRRHLQRGGGGSRSGRHSSAQRPSQSARAVGAARHTAPTHHRLPRCRTRPARAGGPASDQVQLAAGPLPQLPPAGATRRCQGIPGSGGRGHHPSAPLPSPPLSPSPSTLLPRALACRGPGASPARARWSWGGGARALGRGGQGDQCERGDDEIQIER